MEYIATENHSKQKLQSKLDLIYQEEKIFIDDATSTQKMIGGDFWTSSIPIYV